MVVAATVPLEGINVTLEPKPDPEVVDTLKFVGAVMVILLLPKVVPETIKLFSGELEPAAALANAVKEVVLTETLAAATDVTELLGIDTVWVAALVLVKLTLSPL